MSLYHFIRPALFWLNPETAHHYALRSLKFLVKLKLLPKQKIQGQAVRVMGIDFPNRVGIAAGLDRNGEYIDALAALGAGFIEIGTVTPLPQVGNAKPRLFRLTEDKSLINRVGFASKGADYVLAQLKKTHYQGVLGINIGKNKDTPLEDALQDYIICLRKLYPYANYMVINISSPNTEGLRQLQYGERLFDLLSHIKAEQHLLTGEYHRYVPIVVKLSPDLTEDERYSIAQTLKTCKIDGVILSNTTLSRDNLNDAKKTEQGGLSGQALAHLSLESLKAFATLLANDIPIIAAGGIDSLEAAELRLQNGASLVEVYTGLIYEGPGLISQIARAKKTNI